MTRTDAPRSAVSLTLSSLLWTILLPGVVSGYVPWAYFGVRDTSVNLAGPLQLPGLLGDPGLAIQDSGSGTRDPGSGIRDPGSGIRD